MEFTIKEMTKLLPEKSRKLTTRKLEEMEDIGNYINLPKNSVEAYVAGYLFLNVMRKGEFSVFLNPNEYFADLVTDLDGLMTQLLYVYSCTSPPKTKLVLLPE